MRDNCDDQAVIQVGRVQFDRVSIGDCARVSTSFRTKRTVLASIFGSVVLAPTRYWQPFAGSATKVTILCRRPAGRPRRQAPGQGADGDARTILRAVDPGETGALRRHVASAIRGRSGPAWPIAVEVAQAKHQCPRIMPENLPHSPMRRCPGRATAATAT